MLHRNALLSSITVRPIDLTEDENGIFHFLQTVSNGQELSANLQEEGANTFVIVMENQIIGLCVIQLSISASIPVHRSMNLTKLIYSYFKDMGLLTLNYDIRTFMNTKCYQVYHKASLLKMMIMYPAFSMRVPFIVSEVLRLSGCSVMFYKLYDFTQVRIPFELDNRFK